MDHQLLEKYFQNKCNQKERDAVENWLKREEDLPGLPLPTEIPSHEWTVLQRRIRAPRIRAYLYIAASLLLLIVTGTWLFSTHSTPKPLQWKTFGIPNGQLAELTLADGSTIHLNGGTTVSYIQGGREVKLLQGEAFFSIMTDPVHPFIVHTIGDGDIQVLGTRFNVKHNTYTNNLEITLHSGRISFAHMDKRVYLHPGEQLIYHLNDRMMDAPATMDTILASGWHTGRLVFRDTPLPQVFSALEQHFGVTFITTKKINNQLFTAELNNMSLSRVLQLIEMSSNIQCHKEGDTIYVK